MSDGQISFTPLADAVDTLVSSIDLASLPARRQRIVRTLTFQVRALRSVGNLPNTNFPRADWAIGQQAVVAIPILVRRIRERSSVAAEQADTCVREAADLAAQLTAVAEGR